MVCKNCGRTLRTDYSYCPDCGAKVIRNRITAKNLWFDFTERFFNLENSFFRTFIDLFKKPDVVIGGYIDGVRKKYMNPISYFTIALTLGGIVLFLARKNIMGISKSGFMAGMAGGVDSKAENPFATTQFEGIMDVMFDYQNIFYLLSIPLLALISKLVFWNKKQYNLSEHFVINIYAYSHISICVNTLYLISYWNSSLLMVFSQLSMLIYIVYYSFTLKRLFQLNWESIILKLLLFLLILGFIFFLITLGVVIYMLSQPEFIEQLRSGQN